MNLGRALIILVLATGLAACAGRDGAVPEPSLIEVPTQDPGPPGPVACAAALATGTLVADPRWGIALRSPEAHGRITKVVWPHGYVGRRTQTTIELLDASGRVVGLVGARVELGGGFGEDDTFYPCS